MARTVADDLWALLEQAGVTRCYGIVGDALNPTMAALARHGGIEFVHVRNEEWGTFAASAEAYLTEGPVAVCGTAGPGVTHLVNGLLDAYRERCPVIAIAGDMETGAINTQAVEEVDPTDLFRVASLWTGRVLSPRSATSIFTQAISTAVGRGGPTVIALPGDIAAADAVGDAPSLALPQRPVPSPSASELEEIAALVNDVTNITIFGGDGCRNAADDIVALATKLNAPVGFSLKGKQYLEADNPHAVGMTGLLGYGGAFDAVKNADLTLLLGTDFPFPTFLSAGKGTFVQVDTSAERIGRRVPLVASSVSDVGEFVRGLLPLVDEKSDRSHLDKALHITEHWAKKRRAYVDDGEKREDIRPEFLAATLNELMDDDAIVTVDTGTACMWVAHQMDFRGDRRMFGSFNWASMANASPNGFGAAKAFPGRQVVAMCGDGGFTMLALGDLITEVQHNARVVHVVLHNSALDFVEIEQQEAGLIPFGTDMPSPNLAAVGEALGAKGIRVEDPGELRAAVAEALAHTDGPVVMDVVVDRTALSLPSHVPAKSALGFTLSMARRMLRGDAGYVIDLAKDNWKLVK